MEARQKELAANELQLVIFRLAGEEFGLEISEVREIIRVVSVTPMPKAPDFIDGVINLRGQIIAVMNLAKRLGFSDSIRGDKARIVVIEVNDSLLGLIVDEVPEVIRILKTNIEPTPQMIESQVHTDMISGVGKHNGRLIIILDAKKIVTPDEAAGLSAIS